MIKGQTNQLDFSQLISKSYLYNYNLFDIEIYFIIKLKNLKNIFILLSLELKT